MRSFSDSGGIPGSANCVTAPIEISYVLGKRSCEQFGSAMRPTGTQLIDIFTQLFDYLERRTLEKLAQKASGSCS